MASNIGDDLEGELRQNLQMRRELVAELGKADGIEPLHKPEGWLTAWGGFSIDYVQRGFARWFGAK
jgi:hypothetical protein